MTSRIEYNNPALAGKLGLPYHYEMVSDPKRVGPFKLAIQNACKGKRVFESGIGTGIMSILAARAGAVKVYASEIDMDVADFAQKNIEKNGFQDIITILRKNTMDVTIEDLGGEKVDVAIAENLSTWEVNEPEIMVYNHINQSLIKEDGVRIPEIIYNNLELANSQYVYEGVDIRTNYFEFTGIKAPEILSDIILFSEIDLKIKNDDSVNKSIIVEATKDGVVNCLRFTSPLKVGEGAPFASSDSLMPPVIFPIETDIAVKKGDKIKFTIEYDYLGTWDNFKLTAEKA